MSTTNISKTIISLLLFLLSPLSTAASSAAYPTILGAGDTSSCPSQTGNSAPIRQEIYGDGGAIFDISHKYTAGQPAYGSATGLGQIIRLRESMKNGSIANMSEMKLSVHSGTHVDAPGHYIDHYFDDGLDVDSLDLQVLNGPGLLIDVPRDTNITAEVMKSLSIPRGIRRVLFRTLNTDRQLMYKNQFDTSFVGFTEDGAKWLAENTDIKLVGIDYLAVAAWDDLVSAHIAFLEKKDIIIVEGLKLDDVEAGIYFINCLPLRLVGAEGSPARCGGDPLIAEAMSCREALSWLKENMFDRIMIEMDALTVVNALNNNLTFESPVGVIFSDCKSLLRSFEYCRIVFAVRSANHAAHLLARAAGSSTSRGT